MSLYSGSTYADNKVDQNVSLSAAVHGRQEGQPANAYADLTDWLAQTDLVCVLCLVESYLLLCVCDKHLLFILCRNQRPVVVHRQVLSLLLVLVSVKRHAGTY